MRAEMAGRHPSREDRALWRRTMRDVTPLAPAPARRAPEGSDLPQTEADPPRHRGATPAKRAAALPLLAPGDSSGVDRRTAARFRRGQLAMEARLDLHGMTQEEAHRALAGFI